MDSSVCRKTKSGLCACAITFQTQSTMCFDIKNFVSLTAYFNFPFRLLLIIHITLLCDTSVTTTVSQQQCHNSVTTTVSQQQCHNNSVTTTVSQQQCHNSKCVIFQERLLKFLKCYNFLWVQRRHNCSPAASFANCVLILYLLNCICKRFVLYQ